MDNFDVSKWNKSRYLNESQNKEEALPIPSPKVFYLIHEYLQKVLDDQAVNQGDRMSYFSAEFPTPTSFQRAMEVEMQAVNEILNEAGDMITYSVTGITQDPDGGGDAPFGPVDVQIKADTSEDDLYLAIKRAAEDEIADRIYKIKDYSKK